MRSARLRLPGRCLRTGLTVLAAAAVATGVAACGSSGSSHHSSTAVTLRVGVSQGLVDADPHTSTLGTDVRLLEQIYEGLTRINPHTLQVEGALATSWTTSADQLTWTFKLRPGVKFHDGQPLTSADVKYSLDRIRNPATHATLTSDLAPITEVAAQGAGTVVIHLSKPYGILPSILATQVWAAIVPANSGPQLADHPDGTGPFQFVKQVPNTSLTLKAFPGYWDKSEPKVAGVDFEVIPDESARVAALTSRQVDIIDSVPMAQAKQLAGVSAVKLIRYQSAWVDEFGMNTQKAPFSDVRVRQAMAMAINKADVAKAATFGLGTPEDTMVAVGPIHVSVHPLAYNPAKARQLLAQAGYPHGFSFSFAPCGGTAYPQMSRAADEIAGELKAIGVSATPSSLEAGVWVNQVINQHSYQAFICGLTTGIDPDQRTYRYFSSNGSYNFSQYRGPANLDQLLAQGRQLSDPAQRTAIYDQAWQILADQVPWIPLYENPGLMATLSTVSGFITTPDSDLVLTGVSVG